ncbi:MAG: ABC transporter ATP-binding protein [Clostridia bacterium]|nr:ABC transporter ATP-binding protein [Clostridia bacterium]
MNDITLIDVGKHFGDKKVLRHVNLTLPEGEATCLMAPSGAGKTTLVRILLGLLQPDEGRVEGLEGRRLAAVFQEDRLVESMDAVSNLRLFNPKLSRIAAIDALISFGLEDSLEQPVQELSGGMRRRVALLRALLAEWDFLALDEPFKGLDEETRYWIIRRTREITDGRTVLLVTHDPEEARLFGARVERLKTEE